MHVKIFICDILQERSKQLKSFMEGEIDILVCTDIASRGLDTSMVSLF